MNSTYKKLAISELKSKPFSAVKIFFLSFSRKKEFAHGLILKPSCFFGGGAFKKLPYSFVTGGEVSGEK